MEKHFTALQDAKEAIKVADHILTVTHNVVNDPKLLLLVAEKLSVGLQHIVKAVLLYELYHKRIPPFNENTEDFQQMFSVFKVRCMRRYTIDSSYVDLIHNVHELIQHHKQSPVEFSRKDDYVICSEEYKTDVISKKFLKTSIEKSKVFMEDVEKMVTKQDKQSWKEEK